MSGHDQHTHDNSEHLSHPSGYDKHEVSVLGIALVALGSIVFLVVSGALLDTYYVLEREKIAYEQTLKPRDERLITLRSQEDKRLSGYGYADTTKVMAHIPIDSAIQQVVQEYQAKQAGETAR